MTKPKESPYQISLDIPVRPLPEQSALDSDSHQNEPLFPDQLADESNHVPTAVPPSDVTALGHPNPHAVNVTQFSLLDRLSSMTPHQDSLALAAEISATHTLDTDESTHPNNNKVFKRISTTIDIAIKEPYLLPVGTIISSPGGHFTYRILGACCRLFDRNELPWPCCRIQWRSKEPSWRRIGKRLVPDMATKRYSSYMVEIIDHEYSKEPFILTLYWVKLPKDMQNWWCTKYVPSSTHQKQTHES